MATKLLLGELLIQEKLVNQETINDALRVQIGSNRRLGSVLVRMGALSEDRLAEILEAHLGIEITDIQKNFSPDVRKKLPRYLCRKYEAIPLRLKNNNILEVAMSDPSDQQAINDLEQYTGNVIDARLAKGSAIAAGTARLIPYSLHDFFSPQASTRFTRIAVGLCLILVVVTGGFSYRYIQNAIFGTVSTTPESTIYKNHDLMLAFEKNGGINLLGRGAYTQSYYSVSFPDTDTLQTFISKKKQDLSEKQQEWLAWAIAKAGERKSSQSLATKK
jgi:Type II secretion system (T2SS), protein E, N-terminal domain